MARDVIAELRAQDPARRAGLDAVDPGALVALREGITMTAQTEQTERTTQAVPTAANRTRRLGRRGALAAGLSLALAGGGVAFAATQLWSDEETAATGSMGIECQEVFGQQQGDPAPTLTGDPVADCATVRADAGLAPLVDPVAFVIDGAMYVTPRDQVPPGADVIDADPAAAAVVRELEASLHDVVDGGSARCLSAADAAGWVTSEFARLGVVGWSVDVIDRSAEVATGPCSLIEIGSEPRTVAVYPDMDPAVEEWVPSQLLAPLREIGEDCLTVDQAYDVVEAAFGAEPHFPTTRVIDEAAECTRVDMEVGGSYLVTVYGPTTVG